MIRYGFACKTIGIPGAEQTTLTLARADEENLLRVSRQNIGALAVMLRYCASAGIALMRISSDVIPLASHPQVSFDWKNILQPEIATITEILRETGVRVSMHPGQYTVLNSPRDDVVERAVDDLLFHADFLDAVGADASAKIILHLGGGYGDKQTALARLERNLNGLPHHIVGRLALENDERVYTIEEVLAVCGRFSLPAIFDVFHHELHPPSHGDMEYWLDRAGETWRDGGWRQKIHYSQQLAGGKPGMHSQTIGMEPFFAFHESLGGREVDVMLEVKDKNLSVVKCANLAAPNLPRARLTEEWARYKYFVLERDPGAYGAIRELLKSASPDAREFYSQIEKAQGRNITPGHARNAAQHVWGYLDGHASPAEARAVMADMRALDDGCTVLPRFKRKILALAAKYSQEYLMNSLYFYL